MEDFIWVQRNTLKVTNYQSLHTGSIYQWDILGLNGESFKANA